MNTSLVLTIGRPTLGLLLLGLSVLTWVASSFIVSYLFGLHHRYEKPLFITYINTSTFVFYLIPHGFKFLLDILRGIRKEELIPHQPVVDSECAEEDSSHVDAEHSNRPDLHAAALQHFTAQETLVFACQFYLLWFVANYCGNAALSYTDVSSFTILSSLSGAFTLIIGSIFGVERFTWVKVVSLFLSMLGVIVISTSDLYRPSNTPLQTNHLAKGIFDKLGIIGNILALLGAFFYALYTIFLKYRINVESRISMTLFFGFVGAVNILTIWPFLLVSHFLGWEKFDLPPTGLTRYLIAFNASITFISELLWLAAMLMTSPLVVTIGLSLSIPLAMFGAVLIRNETFSIIYWAGAILVLVAFIGVNWDFQTHNDENQQILDGDLGSMKGTTSGNSEIESLIQDNIE